MKSHYEPPAMILVGGFHAMTRGGCGHYYERRYLWY